jgi:hypothetical protein
VYYLQRFFVTVSREFNQPEDLIEVQQAQQKAYLTSSGKGKKKEKKCKKSRYRSVGARFSIGRIKMAS